MSDKAVIAVVAGAVVLALLILFRKRLARVVVDLRRGRVSASMEHDQPLPKRGARQRGIKAPGNVTADDGTGEGVSQENIESGGDVNAIVRQPAGGHASKKK